jgi:hypothetical protein
MQYEVFAVMDVAIKAYMQPFKMQSTNEALRALRNEACDADSMIAKNPNDFVLYRLGTWDNLSGMYTQDEPTRLGSVQELTMIDNEKPTLEEVV